jgi:uncharacterized protein YbjT (DUF2867 family)
MVAVVVAGANGKVGRLLVPKLKQRGHRVIALVRSAEVPDADVVISNWTDGAITSLPPFDTIVNLTGDINPPARSGYAAANSVTGERLATLAAGRPHHAVYISFPGANPQAANAYLATKGKAEQVTRAAACTTTILRTTIICGTPDKPLDSDRQMQAGKGKAARSFGSGRGRLRPVYIGDAVDAVTASIELTLDGTYGLEGPDEMTLDDLLRLINREPQKPIIHTPGWVARFLGPFIGLRREFIDIMLVDQLSCDPDFFRAAQIAPPRSLVDLWRQS